MVLKMKFFLPILLSCALFINSAHIAQANSSQIETYRIQADPQESPNEVPAVEIQSIKRGIGYKLSTFIITSKTQLQIATQRVQEQITNLKKERPQTTVSLVSVNPTTQNHDMVEAAHEVERNLQLESETIEINTQENTREHKKFRQFLKNKGSLMTITLVTAVTTGGATSAAMIYGDSLSIQTSVSMGLLWGAVSGGYIFYNEKFQTWLMKTTKVEKAFIEKLGIKNQAALDAVKATGEWAKYFMHIAGWNYIGAIATSMSARAPMANPGDVFLSSVAEVVSGAPWELAIASDTEKAKLKNPENAKRIQTYSNIANMLNEVLAQTLSVASLTGLQKPALIGLTIMTATGAIYYLKTKLQDKIFKKPHAAGSCRQLFGHLSLPRSDFSYAA